MLRSWHYKWIFFITIQQYIVYAQTKIIKPSLSHPLDMDKAFLTISNRNYSDPILLTYNMIICEQCDFDVLGNAIPMNSNKTVIINTNYPYDFKLLSQKNNTIVICNIESYKFSEHGSYLFEVIQISQKTFSCMIIQTKESSYYWLPIIIAIIILVTVIVSIQLCHCFFNSRYLHRVLIIINSKKLVNEERYAISTTNRRELLTVPDETSTEDPLNAVSLHPQLSQVEAIQISNGSTTEKRKISTRLHGLDTFRGFALMIMIFVNYGGGGYVFFDHSVWNGLTLADLVFPWFTWMMGASIVLSQRSLFKKNVSRQRIFWKICRRTAVLFMLGVLLQGGDGRPKDLRILGVLQRLALCYFFTAIIVLVFEPSESNIISSEWSTRDNAQLPIRTELFKTVFQFWKQWLCVIIITTLWLVVTFVPKLHNCPRGYIGPGGKHEHGKYTNCTGGVAGYLDRVILGSSHLYNSPTCKGIYNTVIPYDPEGLLGILTGILLCYLGAQAGHIFVHSTRVRRTCMYWIVWSLICGFFGLLLSKGGHSDSWIPINKNLWSLTFIFTLSSLAFIILTIFYLLVDVYKIFTGEPWLWLGMNSIVIYVCHDIFGDKFPVQFEVDSTHAKQLALNLYGSMFWALIAGIMYYKKIFIAI